VSRPDGTIPVSLNYFGIPVSLEYLDRLSDGADHSGDLEYSMMEQLLGTPPAHLPRDVLERYVEVSPPESYLPLFPHTDKIFERILSPLRSAKRCYCLGEYLATIELCAHVGEMFAILLWQMRQLHLNGKPIDEATENLLFGRSFERQGQDQRVKMLRAIGAVEAADGMRLDELRRRRRKHFHLWSGDSSDMKSDAFHCFWLVVQLAESVLQISFDDGRVIINPALQAYVDKDGRNANKSREVP
jgi:hypothetical protein